MEKKVTVKQAAEIYRANNNRVVDETVDGFVVLKDVNKIYDNRVQAVFDFNLSIDRNEFIVLVGPSGCGKSTTLRMIAGLEEISSGYLYIDKILSNYLESKDRDIAMVFQSYALYPNMTVFDNIGFGLKVRGVPKDEIKRKVFDVAEILDLGPYLDRKPRELSGGQMQRVALGRAIVRDSKLFLMDEPLSNLDAKLRVQMRSEIVKLHRSIHATTVYVTHDQTEAMTMADRIVIMNKGVVQQIGAPMEIYNDPRNVFVATFIGNPPMNVFETTVKDGKIVADNIEISLPAGAEQKYKKYIAERKEFFIDFEKRAGFRREKKLIAYIGTQFLGVYRKITDKDRRERLAFICDEAAELAEKKNFFSFDDERRAALENALHAGDETALRTGLLLLIDDLDKDKAIVRYIKTQFLGVYSKLTAEEKTERLGYICDELAASAAKKGFIKFDDERRAALESDIETDDFTSLKTDLRAVIADLENTDLVVAGILKKFDSAGFFKAKAKEAEPEFGKKAKKKKKHEKIDLSEQNNDLIEKYLQAYIDAESNNTAFVGIRPEDIRFAADFTGNKSEPFSAEATFVELLGSEFNVYFDLFGGRIIMKSGLSRIIKTGDTAELCFDMDKIKLFDSVSCERVF